MEYGKPEMTGGTPHDLLLGGFNLPDLPLWKMMEFVSWDDEIPNNGKIQSVLNHQPVIINHY